MNTRLGWVYVAALGMLAACGDSEKKDRYDPVYDCRQLFQCASDREASVIGTEQECVEVGLEDYRVASPGWQAGLDEAHSVCADKSSCDYQECMANELPFRRRVAAMAPGTECGPQLSPAEGHVASSLGGIPYTKAEVSFSVNSKGCLNAIDVEFSNASCSMRFSAHGLLDEEGRYLITEVRFAKGGLCPGYPDALSGSFLYRESAKDQPLGTISVTRPDESWHECHPGELVIRPEVTLEGSLDDPDVDLHGAEIRLTGKFTSTYRDSDDSCPVVFY